MKKHAITVTLAEIKEHHPCENGWRKLLKSLGGIRKYGKDTPLNFEQIINSNGIEDALWALRVLGPEHYSLMRHYAVDCAESVKHLMKDERSLKALEVARLNADGKASDNELADAMYAACDAAWTDARYAAMYAARYAARTDARYAAMYAARAAFSELLIEYTRTGERVMNAQDIINKHMDKVKND